MNNNALFVLSEIPTQQTDILKNVPYTSGDILQKILDSVKLNSKIRELSFLNYSKITFIPYKKIVVLQYFASDEYINKYKEYLKKIYKYYHSIKLIETDKIHINSIEDKELKEWLMNYNNYIPSNAEKPLMYLNKEHFDKYLETFECEFENFIYKFVPYRIKEDMRKFLSNLIDDIDVSGQKHIVTNLGKQEYKDALMSIIHKKGIHFQAYENDIIGGYQFNFHTKLQDLIAKKYYINYLSDKDFSIKDLRKLSKKYDIPEPVDVINIKNYYIASISIIYKKSFTLLGPTGSGKSFFVNKIVSKYDKHKNIELNCATLTGGLFRSELFGHKMGAFTSATKDKEGFLSKYNKGIIFLDEIGELQADDQAKILKFLDTKKYTPVGSTEEIKSDALLIFATNRDLKKMCEDGKFRWDLYFRITQVLLRFKHFKDLESDQKKLILQKIISDCNGYLKKNSPKGDKIKLSSSKTIEISLYQNKQLDEDAKYFILYEYHWPGNLREIYNTILKTFMFNSDIKISRLKIKQYLDITFDRTPLDPFNLNYEDIKGKKAKVLLTDIKNKIAELALEKNDGNQAKAAREIGLIPQTFNNWIKTEEKNK